MLSDVLYDLFHTVRVFVLRFHREDRGHDLLRRWNQVIHGDTDVDCHETVCGLQFAERVIFLLGGLHYQTDHLGLGQIHILFPG